MRRASLISIPCSNINQKSLGVRKGREKGKGTIADCATGGRCEGLHAAGPTRATKKLSNGKKTETGDYITITAVDRTGTSRRGKVFPSRNPSQRKKKQTKKRPTSIYAMLGESMEKRSLTMWQRGIPVTAKGETQEWEGQTWKKRILTRHVWEPQSETGSNVPKKRNEGHPKMLSGSEALRGKNMPRSGEKKAGPVELKA